jgi:hypothetical protein
MITLSDTRPRPAPSENMPAPANHQSSRRCQLERLSATVLWSTPWCGAKGGEVMPEGGCEANTMPHSNGLFLTVLWMSRLSWLSAVSSLIRTPSALPVMRLPETIELAVPTR